MREIYNKILANYHLTSLAISGTIIFIFLFFTTKVETFPRDFNSLLISVAAGILIGYLYTLIIYISFNIRPTFEKLRPLFQNNSYDKLLQDLDRKLRKSWQFYLTIIVVVTPFIILNLITHSYFYLIEPTLWSLLLDVFNEGIEYSILFLLAVITWLMITLTLIVNELKEKYTVNIDVFNVDETGGLKPLRYFVLSVVGNYFVILSLAIISYLKPITLPMITPPITLSTILSYIYKIMPKIITPKIIILILMFLIGVILFITTQKTIRNLIDKGVKLELERINRKYKETCDKVIEISSSKGNNDNEKELEKLRIILDILEKEEIKLNRMKHKRFDLRTFITFITTSLLPSFVTIITLIEKMGFTGSDISGAIITFITKPFS